mgnify:CR=1 FL=1
MKKVEEQLHYLNLLYLRDNWSEELKNAEAKEWTPRKFFSNVIEKEYENKRERSRFSRIKAARIPIEFGMETYPFEKQPHLNKKRILENYESLNYIHESRNVVLMGPTGTGKTGLATGFLLKAINEGYRGRFVLFSDLIKELWAAQADDTSKGVINRYASYPCLVIDELGYLEVDPAQVGMFFTLMQKRYKKTCTIITTNLGFNEWDEYLGNKQLAAALIDRLTDNGHVINMRKCQGLRKEAEVD